VKCLIKKFIFIPLALVLQPGLRYSLSDTCGSYILYVILITSVISPRKLKMAESNAAARDLTCFHSSAV